jgi:hypothetical protein
MEDEKMKTQARSYAEYAEAALAGVHGDLMKTSFEKKRAAQDNSEWVKDYRDIFPLIRTWGVMAPRALSTIATYAKEVGLAPLKRNHIRYFCQPWGFVDCGVDVDLATGKLVKYPGDHRKTEICNGIAYPDRFAKLKDLLNSDAFRNLPGETPGSGSDGCSVLIEADLDGTYYWRCYWHIRLKAFQEVAGVLRALALD